MLYWMALALDERGLQEMLKQQFLNMKKTFEEDEYEEFMLRFQEEHNKRNNIAPGKESIFSKFINKGENKNGRRNDIYGSERTAACG